MRPVRANSLDDPYSSFYEENYQKDTAEHRCEYLKRARELERSESFARLDRAARLANVAKTTLSRIDEAPALALVVRGYASTAATLYVTGITDFPEPSGWLGDALA